MNELEPRKRDWLLVAEHFIAPQGEGPHMGRPAFWTRLGGCNLHCRWCDTPQTWVFDDRHVGMHESGKQYDPRAELHRETISDLIEMLSRQYLRRYAITGGEPLLQLDGVSQLISGVNAETFQPFFEIETAGTIAPGQLSLYDNVWFNVSPKLESSGNSPELRFNASALRKFCELAGCFKFVVDTRTPQYELEVEEVHKIVDLVGIKHDRIWLMPCGVTTESVIAGMRLLEPIAVENEWNLSSRLQVLMHGNERGH